MTPTTFYDTVLYNAQVTEFQTLLIHAFGAAMIAFMISRLRS